MAMTALPTSIPALNKRKHNSTAAVDASSKRQCVGKSDTKIASRLPSEPHQSILTELRPKYDVATFSVISSTSISKRIDQILAHLGKFHPVDMAVLPGIALMHARSRDAAKMVSVTELVRRRINECGQKWYQYNRLYEVAAEFSGAGTVLAKTGLQGTHQQEEAEEDDDDDDEDDDEKGGDEAPEAGNNYFGGNNVFERAVLGQPKPEKALYMSIFLSRVPIPELKAKNSITTQSNSDLIDQLRRQRHGQ